MKQEEEVGGGSSGGGGAAGAAVKRAADAFEGLCKNAAKGLGGVAPLDRMTGGAVARAFNAVAALGVSVAVMLQAFAAHTAPKQKKRGGGGGGAGGSADERNAAIFEVVRTSAATVGTALDDICAAARSVTCVAEADEVRSAVMDVMAWAVGNGRDGVHLKQDACERVVAAVVKSHHATLAQVCDAIKQLSAFVSVIAG